MLWWQKICWETVAVLFYLCLLFSIFFCFCLDGIWKWLMGVCACFVSRRVPKPPWRWKTAKWPIAQRRRNTWDQRWAARRKNTQGPFFRVARRMNTKKTTTHIFLALLTYIMFAFCFVNFSQIDQIKYVVLSRDFFTECSCPATSPLPPSFKSLQCSEWALCRFLPAYLTPLSWYSLFGIFKGWQYGNAEDLMDDCLKMAACTGNGSRVFWVLFFAFQSKSFAIVYQEIFELANDFLIQIYKLTKVWFLI